MAAPAADQFRVPEWADLIGRPFAYGGRGPKVFDCYGLVWEMNRRAGLCIPEYASPRTDEEIAALMEVKRNLWTPCARKPGALVMFRIGRLASHVGYVIDPFRMIHVWQRSGGVCVERLSDWERRVVSYYEFDPQ